MSDETICTIHMNGILPTKSLWERIKQVFKGEPDSFRCTIEIGVGIGEYMWIPRVTDKHNLTCVSVNANILDPDVWGIVHEKWEKANPRFWEEVKEER